MFYVYYVTIHGDVLGTLRLTDLEMIFEPLNSNFKGIYLYKSGNLNENHKTSFCISFEDIPSPPLIIPCPSLDPHDIEEMGHILHLQLYLKHTGNKYYASKQALEVIKSDSAKGLASLDIKLKITGIDGNPWDNAERRVYAEILYNKICDRMPN